MKRRVTLVQGPSGAFDPKQAVLSSSSLKIRDLDSARQERITLSLDELPEEVRQDL